MNLKGQLVNLVQEGCFLHENITIKGILTALTIHLQDIDPIHFRNLLTDGILTVQNGFFSFAKSKFSRGVLVPRL